ncbi:MAG: (2Fe-2S)-binding protein [Thermodesulfobacteriota bacterium]
MDVELKKHIRVTINGVRQALSIPANRMLVDLLREDLGLTGTKKGCESGECGACSVILDGRLVDSCLVPAMKVDGSEILTVEGLAEDNELHPIQKAFWENGAVQCGYCTPGMLLSAKSLMDENPTPTKQDIQAALAGNLCRCTGYVKIIDAITTMSEKNQTLLKPPGKRKRR